MYVTCVDSRSIHRIGNSIPDSILGSLNFLLPNCSMPHLSPRTGSQLQRNRLPSTPPGSCMHAPLGKKDENRLNVVVVQSFFWAESSLVLLTWTTTIGPKLALRLEAAQCPSRWLLVLEVQPSRWANRAPDSAMLMLCNGSFGLTAANHPSRFNPSTFLHHRPPFCHCCFVIVLNYHHFYLQLSSSTLSRSR